MHSDRELSLRDLVMAMRSDVSGTGETCADRDEAKGTSDIQELSLREIAHELGEEAPRASAPKPPGADAQSLKRMAALPTPRNPGQLCSPQESWRWFSPILGLIGEDKKAPSGWPGEERSRVPLAGRFPSRPNEENRRCRSS
jgi:hypothetical protein